MIPFLIAYMYLLILDTSKILASNYNPINLDLRLRPFGRLNFKKGAQIAVCHILSRQKQHFGLLAWIQFLKWHPIWSQFPIKSSFGAWYNISQKIFCVNPLLKNGARINVTSSFKVFRRFGRNFQLNLLSFNISGS